MANSARTQPGVERENIEIVNETDPLDNVQVIYEKNKKMITTAAAVIIGAVVLYFGYTKLYKGPAEEKAAAALAYPQLYFSVDSLNLALNGDGKNLGFIKVASKHSGTAAANLSKYYMGICYLKMDDYKNAIKNLEDFDGKGTMVAYQAWGSLGDAYMASGNTAKAIEYFKKAADDKDNGLTTPAYLYKLGLAYATTGKPNEAKDAFKRIRDEYPRSMQARDIDKELARVGEVN
ncbi:MAG: tetratricopeptide repeat protein [Bacteroidota bacterium]